VRLDPVDVPYLPLPAAMLDRTGQPVAQTPEWRGAGPGSLTYHAGHAQLVVGPTEAVPTGQQALMAWLLRELEAAAGAMPADQALLASVLTSSLELVAGASLDVTRLSGNTSQVFEYARAAIAARTSDVRLEITPEAAPQPVPAPAQIALALVQLAVNAATHDGARTISLRVDLGPTFWVEWPSERGERVQAGGHPHQRRRPRWGLGYVRMVADALGATTLPPGPSGRGLMGACLSLGNQRFTLPVAVYSGWQVTRSTQTWEQELAGPDSDGVARTWQAVTGTLQAAWQQPGRVARHDLYAARHVNAGTWISLVPEAGADRTRDVLRGLDHERALWSAPEPYATTVHSLITLLTWSLDAARTAIAPDAFAREFPRACAALGMPVHAVPPLLACPDPRVTAFLLRELGGSLVSEPEGASLQPPPSARRHPIIALLAGPDGRLRLTPQS
jgi:hypothetical protein